MKITEQFTILIVEDNPPDCFLIEQMLQSSGLPIERILVAERHSEAISLLSGHQVSLVLLDLSLPDSFGMKSFTQLKERFHQVPIIILTGLSDSEIALQALNLGAQDYLVKGEFNTSFLIKSIKYSIERKRAEEKLLQSEEKYRQIFYKNPFPMWITERETHRILEVNEAAMEKYGYDKEEFIAMCSNQIQSPCIDPMLLALCDDPGKKLWNHYKRNGELMIVELTVFPIEYFGKTARQVQIIDVTEKLFLERELSLKNQQMIEAVLNAQEHERKVIGEELHDNINQILTAIKVGLGFVLEHDEPPKDLLGRCMNNATLAIEEVRRLSRALILPSNLRELGLVPSLEILVKDIQSITSLRIKFSTWGFREEALTEDLKTALYRIVQEQMNNILNYAHASEVEIDLGLDDGEIKLDIGDNGKGFDPSLSTRGVGLYNIANRARLFGGELRIDSAPGQGCRLQVTLYSKTSRPQEVPPA